MRDRLVSELGREFASGRAPSICFPGWGEFLGGGVHLFMSFWGVPCVWYAEVLEKSGVWGKWGAAVRELPERESLACGTLGFLGKTVNP